MKKIKYTPDATDKLRGINRRILMMYGRDKAKKIVGNIMNTINELAEYEYKGPSVESVLGVDSDYRYIYVNQNYIFYSVDEDYIKIINIYNEKEDFMWRLFGVNTTSQATLDFWDE